MHLSSRLSNNIKFIDLFAGIGGMRIPFEELGGECVFTSEIDKFAQQTYEANFNEKPFGDIKEATKSDETIKEHIPKHDILLAGFPCQAFSQAGKRKGFEDTRGTLFFDIAKILKVMNPKAFLLENVKGLRGHDQGNTIKRITEIIVDLGYYPSYEVLNSKDFGLPQNRERIFIVGLKESMFNFQLVNVPKVPTQVRDILEKKSVTEDYKISTRLHKSHKRRKIEHKKNNRGFGFSLKKPSDPHTNTLSARYYKDGSEILIDRGGQKNPRMLTPREAARLQGFPESFEIPVSKNQAYKQFGNAVSVNVVREIAKALVKNL